MFEKGYGAVSLDTLIKDSNCEQKIHKHLHSNQGGSLWWKKNNKMVGGVLRMKTLKWRGVWRIACTAIIFGNLIKALKNLIYIRKSRALDVPSTRTIHLIALKQ